jgi:hypothetical protein
MAHNHLAHTLKLIVPYSAKKRVCKLMSDTRTHTVSSEFVLMDNMQYQESVIYTWNFNNEPSLDIKKTNVVEKLNSENVNNYHIVVA